FNSQSTAAGKQIETSPLFKKRAHNLKSGFFHFIGCRSGCLSRYRFQLASFMESGNHTHTTTSINYNKAIKIKSQASMINWYEVQHEISIFHKQIMYIKISSVHNNIVKQLQNCLAVSKLGEDLH